MREGGREGGREDEGREGLCKCVGQWARGWVVELVSPEHLQRCRPGRYETINSLIQLLNHSLAHSLTHSLAHSLTLSLSHARNHSLRVRRVLRERES